MNNTCPRCGKQMVQKPPQTIYLTYPAQYDQVMWCGCGHQENRGRVYEKTQEQMLQDEWNRINHQ